MKKCFWRPMLYLPFFPMLVSLLTKSSMISLMADTNRMNRSGNMVVNLPVGDTPGICCGRDEKTKWPWMMSSWEWIVMCKLVCDFGDVCGPMAKLGMTCGVPWLSGLVTALMLRCRQSMGSGTLLCHLRPRARHLTIIVSSFGWDVKL